LQSKAFNSENLSQNKSFQQILHNNLKMQEDITEYLRGLSKEEAQEVLLKLRNIDFNNVSEDKVNEVTSLLGYKSIEEFNIFVNEQGRLSNQIAKAFPQIFELSVSEREEVVSKAVTDLGVYEKYASKSKIAYFECHKGKYIACGAVVEGTLAGALIACISAGPFYGACAGAATLAAVGGIAMCYFDYLEDC
jgi:restriction endonuclease Mrr